MLAAAIPYVEIHAIGIGPVKIQPFGALVVAGILIGTALARWRAPRYGIAREELDSFVWWMLAVGFVGAHVLDTIFYHPDTFAERPWSLLFIWEGISSFGGFVGALVGVLLWKYKKGQGKSILALADCILSVFPVAWIFGRMGCSVVHDHPGALTSGGGLFGWLAVPYPTGLRWDLGVMEAFFALCLSAVIAPTWRLRLPLGTYAALVPMAYAPARFLMDFLREDDEHGGDVRWFGLTFAQWLCVGLFIIGAWLLVRVIRNPQRPAEASA